MSEEREKYCPQCGVPHQAWATRCADCDCALSYERPVRRDPVRPAELPPARELACLRTGDPWHVRELAEALQEAGISCRIDSFPPEAPLTGPGLSARGRGAPEGATKLGVYVAHADAAAGQRIERELLASRMAGAPEGAASDADGCPACGSPLAPTATECPECGLEFPESESGTG
jgi:hypothetical protein